MKSFFEEYGFVILVAVVVIALISMVSPVGDAIEENMLDVIDGFTTKVNTELNITG